MVDNRMIDNTSGDGQSMREAAGRSSSRMEQARHAVTDAAHRIRDKAGDAAHRAGERATHAIDEQKGRVASRLSRIATSMRDAGHCFADNDESGLGQYVEMAADRLEEVGDYLQEHPFDELRHEASMFLRRHPEVGLAGAFIGGILIGRFLRASATAGFDEQEEFGSECADEFGNDAEAWDEDDAYAGSSAGYSGSSFAGAGAARAAHGPGRGAITPSSDVMSSGPTSPGHAMARGGAVGSPVQSSASPSQSSSAARSSRSDSGGESCAL